MSIRARSTLVVVALVAAVLAATPGGAAAEPVRDPKQPVTSASYQVIGPKNFNEVNAIAATGAAVDGVEHGRVQITATAAEVAAIALTSLKFFGPITW